MDFCRTCAAVCPLRYPISIQCSSVRNLLLNYTILVPSTPSPGISHPASLFTCCSISKTFDLPFLFLNSPAVNASNLEFAGVFRRGVDPTTVEG
ncbi:hypothetical protein PoB_006236600 [Plakobranchus ocellatus]|uniref:4Fe-4S ferredoxin-type domain-containing protein n=1 Tax=Plakobranchus ocellatus TaxID=259542 RepID=A0AAV4CVC7_9GAST|nr:hypothetical protein PoB_006236600 [Plakobranchus ocellatus]